MAKDFIDHRIRTRTDGMWEIVWNDPKTGKTIRRSCRTRNEREAKEKLAEKILSGDVVPPDAVTIGYILDRYYSHLQRRKKESTLVPLRSKLERLKDYMGDIKWDDFTQTHVEDFVDHARTLKRWDREDQKPLSDGTIRTDLEKLRAALRHASLHKIVPSETRIEIRDLESEHRTDWMDRDQFRRVLEVCANNDDRDHIYGFLWIALSTGARKEAIFELTWDNIYIPSAETELVDVEPTPVVSDEGEWVMPPKARQRRVVARQALDYQTGKVVSGAIIDFGKGAGNKRRPKIPIGQNPELMEYLLAGDRSQPYVLTYKGKPIQTGIKKGLEAVGKEANLPFKLTHHVLKRTCITWMVQAGISFEDIERLTNTTVETLKRHYSQFSPDLEETLGDTFSLFREQRTASTCPSCGQRLPTELPES